MTAYSFMPQFVEPIRAGAKGGTIRAPRKIPAKWSDYARARRPGGHAKSGEFVDLYCRQRHPSGFLICQRTCLAVVPIRLDFIRDRVTLNGTMMSGSQSALDAFARFDGFESWGDLAAFWRSTHGVPDFEGWHIRWLPMPEPAP